MIPPGTAHSEFRHEPGFELCGSCRCLYVAACELGFDYSSNVTPHSFQMLFLSCLGHWSGHRCVVITVAGARCLTDLIFVQLFFLVPGDDARRVVFLAWPPPAFSIRRFPPEPSSLRDHKDKSSSRCSGVAPFEAVILSTLRSPCLSASTSPLRRRGAHSSNSSPGLCASASAFVSFAPSSSRCSWSSGETSVCPILTTRPLGIVTGRNNPPGFR